MRQPSLTFPLTSGNKKSPGRASSLGGREAAGPTPLHLLPTLPEQLAVTMMVQESHVRLKRVSPSPLHHTFRLSPFSPPSLLTIGTRPSLLELPR